VNINHIWIAFALLTVMLSGCATGSTRTKELRRLDNAAKLKFNGKVGMTNFSKCGGAYLDRLNPDYHEVDSKAVLYQKCTELGYPTVFQNKLRSRLEQNLGKRLTAVNTDKNFKANLVFKEAERLGLDYVISGDQLYLAENESNAVVSVLFYVISVSEKKIVLLGRVQKNGDKGKLPELIDAVADELFYKAYLD